MYVCVCELRSWEQGAGYGHTSLVGEGVTQWFFQGYSLNAECIWSGRGLPSPKGALEESQISRESIYKVKAGSPLKTQLHPPPSCLLTLRCRRRGTKNVNMTWLPDAPTRGIHRGFRWTELDHHGLLRLGVNHERFVNKLKCLLWIWSECKVSVWAFSCGVYVGLWSNKLLIFELL